LRRPGFEMVTTEYPMRTAAEMQQSLAKAALDHRTKRISDADFKQISLRFARRMIELRKNDLLSSVATLRTRSSNDPRPEPMSRGAKPMRRQQGRRG